MKKFVPFLVLTLIFVFFTAIPAYSADQYIEGAGTPFCTVDSPLGGGSRDINIINDGVTDDSNGQYDTYIEGNEPYEIAFGYTFEESYIVKQVEFTEGGHFEDGGWYANGDIKVQVLVEDKWVDVESMKITPDYPNSDYLEDFGDPHETYTFTFTPVECTGVQVFGTAGGSATFASCAELKVLAEEVAVEAEPIAEITPTDPIETTPTAVEQQSALVAEFQAPPTSDTTMIYLAMTILMTVAVLIIVKKYKIEMM